MFITVAMRQSDAVACHLSSASRLQAVAPTATVVLLFCVVLTSNTHVVRL